MNTNNAPRIGDKVYLNYGVMCGENYGTLYGVEKTQWGTNYRVKLSDGSFETCSTLRSIDNRAGIGAYYWPTSPLRQVRLGV